MSTARRPRHGLAAEVWQVEPFQQAMNRLRSVRRIAVPSRPLGLILGPAGVGKTFLAEQYALNNADTLIVTVPPKDILTPRSLLMRYAEAVGVPTSTETVMGLYRTVVNALNKRDYFVIVDEADRLRPSNADLIRELAEETSRATCFMGCPSLLAVLEKVAPTHHRIGVMYRIEAITQDDLYASLHGRPLLTSTAAQPQLPETTRNFDEPAVKAIWDVTGGNLRHIAALLASLRTKRPDASRRSAFDPLAPQFIRSVANEYQMPAAA